MDHDGITCETKAQDSTLRAGRWPSVKDVRDIWRIGHWSDRPLLRRHKMLSFAYVFKPCQFKRSSMKDSRTVVNSLLHLVLMHCSVCTVCRVSGYMRAWYCVSFHVFLRLNRQKYTKLCQNTDFGKYPRKQSVMSLTELNQLRKKTDLYHIWSQKNTITHFSWLKNL